MTTSLAKRPTAMKSEALASYVETQYMAGLSRTLKELAPFIKEIWRRLKAGETISGCTNRKEYCEQVLGKTDRAVRYALKGGNPGTHHALKAETLSAPDVSRPALPAQKNKHLVGVQIGDVVEYNTSSGARSAEVIEIGADHVKIKTGVTSRSIKTVPLDIDTQTIRHNMTKALREPDYTSHTGRAGHCVKCRAAGLPNGQESCVNSEAVDAEFEDIIPPAAEVRSADEQPALPADPRGAVADALDKWIRRHILSMYGYYAAKFTRYPEQHTTELAIIEQQVLQGYETVKSICEEKLAAGVVELANK